METFRVLVVDDDMLVRLATADFLRSEGYEVIEADGASNALKIVGGGGVDLVVMDIQMPDIDGIEATRMIHALVPALPVFAFTGSPDLVREVHGLFQGVFTKPMSFTQMIESVRLLTAHRGMVH